MIEFTHFLIGFPDFARQEAGKAFIWNGQSVQETSLEIVAEYAEPLATIEYGALASEMVHRGLSLPATVLDLGELCHFVSRENDLRKLRKRFDIYDALARFGVPQASVKALQSLTHSADHFPLEILEAVGKGMERACKALIRLATIRGEWARFCKVEIPVSRVLYGHLLQGIRFDEKLLRSYREGVEHDYYMALKEFSAKHDLPLAVPNRAEINAILSKMGFDLQNVSPDFIIEYLVLERGLGDDLVHLKAVRALRDALNGISQKKSLTYPEVYVHGTRTSRIIVRAPSLQNLSTKYRDVLKPANSCQFSYVDYDQFEVGIMAALSGDRKLLEFYESEDLYENLSSDLFGAPDKRKDAKRLFLSYAYGMSQANLVRAATTLGATKESSKETFAQFAEFEEWKKGIAQELASKRKIGTIQGNYFYLSHSKKPTSKDIRSAVSQRVQGTGALIFKRALLALSEVPSFRIVLPMHDAVLVEHKEGVDPVEVVEILEASMTATLDGKVQGKASITEFAA